MPHKPATANGVVPVYVSVNLVAELKPLLRQWADNNQDDLLKYIEQVLYEDYALSVKAENETGFQASLRATEKCKKTENKGKMLIERGSTPTRALMRLFWAHFKHFEGTWPKGDRQVDDDW